MYAYICACRRNANFYFPTIDYGLFTIIETESVSTFHESRTRSVKRTITNRISSGYCLLFSETIKVSDRWKFCFYLMYVGDTASARGLPENTYII